MQKERTKLDILREKVENLEAKESRKAEKENIRQEIDALKRRLKGKNRSES